MGSESPSSSIATWLALRVSYQCVIHPELGVLCGGYHLTFACMRHWFSRLLQSNLACILSITSLQQKLENTQSMWKYLHYQQTSQLWR